MKSSLFLGAGLLALAACAQPIPESGVGFSDYSQFELERAQQEAAAGGVRSTELAAAGIGAQPAQQQPIQQQPAQQQTAQAQPAQTGTSSGGISDEQDFSAVSQRETIESDAERRAQQAAQYQIVDPGAVPTRDGQEGPNIVEYALSAPNKKGQEWYSRFRLSGQGRFERNCAAYNSPDEAQRDFLARGGPERDPRGIDPDGDGFACGWDPAPFLLAVQARNGG